MPRQVQDDFHHVFLTDTICDSNITSSARLFGAGKIFPLYLYPENNDQQTLDDKPERRPNLDAEIVQEISDGLDLKFVPEPEKGSHSERSEVEESPDRG